MSPMVTALLGVLAGGLFTLLALTWRRRAPGRLEELFILATQRQLAALRDVGAGMDATLRSHAALQGGAQRDTALAVTESVARLRGELGDALGARLSDGHHEMRVALQSLQDRVVQQLEGLRQEHAHQLELVRATVDEKLTATLQARLGESFRLVGERLEQVQKGLGEMTALAQTFHDLRRVLTNVKARGVVGEVALGALLEDALGPAAVVRNVATRPGATERVEFAVRLPRPDGSGTMWLPLDAKFPVEDHARLLAALDAGDQPAAQEARRALRARLLKEAETIHAKYVSPPHTTEMAVLFVPTESLYAELLRLGGAVEDVQSRLGVLVAGPTTLHALLGALRLGLRSYALERRGAEVWERLGQVKVEFHRFGEALDAVRRKLEEAAARLEETQVRSRAVARSLSQVEEAPLPLEQRTSG